MQKIKDFFTQDKGYIGALAVVLSEVAVVVLLLVALIIAGETPAYHLRWFAGAALPALLVVRAYAKHQSALSATKGAIVALFLTFVVFMTFLIKSKII